MIGVFIAGVALFILGGIVGRVGQKLGTALSIAITLAWFGMLAWLGLTENLNGPTGQTVALYLMVGSVAFLVGSNLTSRWSSPRNTREEK